MKVRDRRVTRRAMVTGGLAAAGAWAARPLFRLGSAEAATQADIQAVSVPTVPADPDDPQWAQAPTLAITMLPQNLVLPRVMDASVKALNLRALYDNDRVAFLLEWPDAHRDADLGTVMQYRDGAAIMFPVDPTTEVAPSYTMGNPGSPVVIYHWKSDWQFGSTYDVEKAYPNMYADWYMFSGVEPGKIAAAGDYLTKGNRDYLTAAAAGNTLADPIAQQRIGPVQKMRAEGFGTIEPDATQDAQGKGSWKENTWRIAISVPRKQASFTFLEGMQVPLALAAWDGSRSERNGSKSYAPWITLAVGPGATSITKAGSQKVNSNLWGGLIGGAGTAVLAGAALIMGFRLWRTKGKNNEGQ